MPAVVGNPFRLLRRLAVADRRWVVVRSGWLLLAVGLVGFVLRFGQNAPLSDEWVFLAELVGERPAAAWLCEPHNEHRFPLPRLLWLACHRLTGFDFRAPMLLSAVLVSAAALALVAAARTIRGRSHVADLLLPALLLHLGHWENWLIGYQLAFTVGVAAVGFVLASAASGRVKPTACAAATVALALCGGAGVLLAMPLAVWVGWAAVRGRRWPALGLVAAVLGYAAAYVAVLRLATVPPPATWADRAATAAQLLAGGAGVAGRETWPVSGVVAAGIIGGAMVLSGVAALRKRGDERLAAAGVLAVLVGVVGVAGAVAVSRTGLDAQPGFSSRYGLFGALGFCAAYLAAVRFGPAVRWGGPAAVAAAVAVIAASVGQGVEYGEYYRHGSRAMAYRVRAGATADELVPEFVDKVFAGADTPQNRAWMRDGLAVLERRGLGPYRGR